MTNAWNNLLRVTEAEAGQVELENYQEEIDTIIDLSAVVGVKDFDINREMEDAASDEENFPNSDQEEANNDSESDEDDEKPKKHLTLKNPKDIKEHYEALIGIIKVNDEDDARSQKTVYELSKLTFSYRSDYQKQVNNQKLAKISSFFVKESEKNKREKGETVVFEDSEVPVIDLTDEAATNGIIIAECKRKDTSTANIVPESSLNLSVELTIVAELHSTSDLLIDIDDVLQDMASLSNEEETANKLKTQPTTSLVEPPPKPQPNICRLTVNDKVMSVELKPLMGNHIYDEMICEAQVLKNLKMVSMLPNCFFPSKKRFAMLRDKHFIYLMSEAKTTTPMQTTPLTNSLLEKLLSEKALAIDQYFLKENTHKYIHTFHTTFLLVHTP